MDNAVDFVMENTYRRAFGEMNRKKPTVDRHIDEAQVLNEMSTMKFNELDKNKVNILYERRFQKIISQLKQ